MSQVVVYSSERCPYCTAAKNLLQANFIDFEEVVLGATERGQLFELTGGMSFPQVVIGGETIGGFDQLRALQESGRLAELIS